MPARISASAAKIVINLLKMKSGATSFARRSGMLMTLPMG